VRTIAGTIAAAAAEIIITAAAPFVPPKLVEQLKPGGIMVLPVNEGEGDQQRMIRITKDANGEITETSFDIFSFVPMLTGKNR
jgi:protein-L-isoaspartate(D-aspartate) O-methyltransferase